VKGELMTVPETLAELRKVPRRTSASGVRVRPAVVPHTPTVDISDDGQRLETQWDDVNNNVCGVVQDCRDAAPVAATFVRAGWSSRSSSWYGYEVEASWGQIELDPMETREVLLNGVIDPERLDDLAGLLSRFGLRFTLELYDDSGALVREIQT
jgi:hypothetical protein